MAVYLREVLPGDLPFFYEHQSDQVANRLAAFLAHWTRILADSTVDKQTIVYNGKVAGNIVCFEASGKREIGYWLGRSYWGKRVTTMALTKFLGQITHRPLFAHVAKHNNSSIRVLEKCGFTPVGEDKKVAVQDSEVVKGIILRLV